MRGLQLVAGGGLHWVTRAPSAVTPAIREAVEAGTHL